MKVIVVIAFVLVATQCAKWDLWHGINPVWKPLSNQSKTWGLSGWERNGPSNQHYTGYFNNYTEITSQYLYWNTEDPNILIFCSPKYYLYN